MPTQRDPVSIPHFSSTQLTLLEKEREAEVDQHSELLTRCPPSVLQRHGLACLNLSVSQVRTGLGGKTVVTLEPDPATSSSSGKPAIQPHTIRTGDIVRIEEHIAGAARKKVKAEAKDAGLNAVVVKVREGNISVALDKADEEVPWGKRVWIVKLSNDVTFKRMTQTVTRLQKMENTGYATFVQVMFGLTAPTPVSQEEMDAAVKGFLDESLNDSQKEAVRFALASREIALIHGPPGTGKTHTVVEVIRQIIAQGGRVLVCGPSNMSVDLITERLAAHKIPIVRLGHPARLLPSVEAHSLDVLTRSPEAGGDIVSDIRKEMDDKLSAVKKSKTFKERREIYKDLNDLRKEFRFREKKCVSDLVRASKVVLSTLHGSGGHQLDYHENQFDCVIIDEASQAIEAQSWVPLLNAPKKCILAGDHLQLPPTIKSKDGAALAVTLFDRLIAMHGNTVVKMLTTQYRMNELIMNFPSEALYESRLVADASVKDQLLKDMHGVEDTEDTGAAVVFWDTQGGDFQEDPKDDLSLSKAALFMESKSNEAEALLCVMHVKKLLEAGVREGDIGVITPYTAQVALLSSHLKEAHPDIELGSIDGFQGREKEAIVISLVRSNQDKQVGFLSEMRRLNVAMTRPKRHLCVIGDSVTVASGSKYLKQWMEHLEEHADLRYPDVTDVLNIKNL